MHILRTLTVSFLSLFLFAIQPLSAEIYEIRLTVENMVCPYCARSVTDMVKKSVSPVESAKAWTAEGICTLKWNQETPFVSGLLFRAFAQTHFCLKNVDIDVEGVIENRKGAMILRSMPENSLFYIENTHTRVVSRLKEGELIRLQGRVTNQSGYNYLYVDEVLPPVE